MTTKVQAKLYLLVQKVSLDFRIDNIIYAFGVAEFESGYRNATRVEKEIR